MSNATWFLVIGAVLLFMALTAASIKRLPLSTAIVYLGVGAVLGPTFANQFHFNPLEKFALLEVITELAVIISLFAAGLKLAAPVGARIWWLWISGGLCSGFHAAPSRNAIRNFFRGPSRAHPGASPCCQ